MHGKTMRYVLVAAAALVAGLLLAGSPVQAVLPFLLLLACPLMMIVMMRGMGGHGDGHSHDAGPTQSIGHDHSGELKAPVSDRRGLQFRAGRRLERPPIEPGDRPARPAWPTS